MPYSPLTRVLVAGYYTPVVSAIIRLFSLGYHPEQIGLLTHQEPRNQFAIEFAKVNGLRICTDDPTSGSALGFAVSGNYDILASLYYRKIFPAHFLERFEGKAFNLHPGKLPEYRGTFSIPWAIINDEKHVTITYHYMTPEVDAGDIIMTDQIPILNMDTAFSLYNHVLSSAFDYFSVVMSTVRAGKPGTPQQGTPGYYPREVPFGGYIDPNWDVEKINRFIRAMYFPPFKPAMFRDRFGIDHEITSIARYHEVVNA